ADAAQSVPPGAWNVLLSDGTRLAEPVGWAAPAGRRGTVRVFAADFTGDGKDDVARLTRAGEWVVGVSDGQSFTTSVWDTWPRVLPHSVRVGDFDGDGKADVAALTRAGELRVGLSTGAGFNSSAWATRFTGRWTRLLVGDFNGDGKDDLAGLRAGSWQVAVSAGTGFEVQTWGAWADRLRPGRILAGDFNGDGRADVVGVTLRGELRVGWSDGSAFQTAAGGSVWPDARRFLAGDFNGDGTDEIVERRKSQVRIASLANFPTLEEHELGWSPAPARPYGWAADFDGDGRPDLVSRTGAGAWFVTRLPDGWVPKTRVWFYPYPGEIAPYASGAPWNPDFARNFIDVTPSYLHRGMNFNTRAAFTEYVYTYYGVLRGWYSEALAEGLTDRDAFRAFLRAKLDEKITEVRPALETKYPGLTDTQYRLLMTLNLVNGHFRFATGERVRTLFGLVGAPDGNCGHIAWTVQALALIQDIPATHYHLTEQFDTPYGRFAAGHNLVFADGLLLDAEIGVAFNIGSLQELGAISPSSRLPRLLAQGRVLGFYNWLNSPPVRGEQLARGEDGGGIAYYYWFYLWGLDQGATQIRRIAPLTR
ncbi:MAG: VCBS repeat-containing protein, partial [Zavarzinella sp.]|nr:VCBS repeat-containing protein [Zavarzinella sp.]